MADKQRSPNYPGFGLPEAILKAKQLYDHDGKSTVPREAAVQAWGYQGLNGASLRVLGALRQYAMLDSPSPGNVKLSPDALVFCFEPTGSAEWRAAVSSVAMRPPVFRALRKQYPDGLPSDTAIVSFLVRNSNFSEDAARVVIAAYRDTLPLVKAHEDTDIPADNADDDGPGSGSSDPSPREKSNRGRDMPVMETTAGQPYDLTLALMGGVQATLRIPRHMSEDNYQLLTGLIEANLKAMKPALVALPGNGDSGAKG